MMGWRIAVLWAAVGLYVLVVQCVWSGHAIRQQYQEVIVGYRRLVETKNCLIRLTRLQLDVCQAPMMSEAFHERFQQIQQDCDQYLPEEK